MRIGFFAPHVGPGSSRDAIARACDIADELGADTLWSVDHIAFPYGFRAVYPYATHEFGEVCAKIKAADFAPSRVAFDAAFARE